MFVASGICMIFLGLEREIKDRLVASMCRMLSATN